MKWLPGWLRLVLLVAVCAAALMFAGPLSAGLLLAFAGTCLLISPRPWPWRLITTVLAMALLTGGYQGVTSSLARGFEVGSDLLASVIMAVAVAAVTPIEEVARLITNAVQPLKFLGVSPSRVGLLVTLTLAILPRLTQTVTQTRQAAIARGLGHTPRAHIAPVVFRAVADAQVLGDALIARGLSDQPHPLD